MDYSTNITISNTIRRSKDIMAWGFVLSAIAFQVIKAFYGIDFMDTFYYLNSYQDGAEKMGLICATQSIGNFISHIEGYELWHYRLLNVLFRILAVIIPFLFLLPQGSKKDSLFFLALSILCIPAWNVFGPDTFTMFCLSAVTTIVIKILTSQPRNIYAYLPLLALISCFATFCRMPNIATVFVLFIIVIISVVNKQISLRKASIYLLV